MKGVERRSRSGPRRHPVYLALVALCAVGSAPLAFIGADNRFFLGLPLWLWSSIAFTLALSALTIWGIHRYWPEEEEEEPR